MSVMMRMVGACLGLALCLGSQASWAQDVSKPGLTGEFRTTIVQTGIAACRKLKNDPRAAWIAPDVIDRSCTCVANQLADRISVNDATQIMMLMMTGTTPSVQDLQPYQGVILESVGTCLVDLGGKLPR